jgi:hypothetical protein
MQPQILVLAFHRPGYLYSTLESLRRQGAMHRTHVWLDGTGGLPYFAEVARGCRVVAQEFAPAGITALCGNVGINKLMLDSLWTMSDSSGALIVLEDDSFPSKSAVAEFDYCLDSVRDRPEIFSVYGHHFLVEGEERPFPRFQGWGFAAWNHQLRPVLEEARRLYAMPEPEFLAWVREHMTPAVRERLALTPGRDPAAVIQRLFSWDACFAMLTAMRGLLHLRTRRRVVYNCGLGGGHFTNDEMFQRPPFNMVPYEKIWTCFEEGLC